MFLKHGIFYDGRIWSKMTNPTHRTPLDFSHEVPPESVGMNPAAIGNLAHIFERQIAEGQHPGAQFVVLRHGQVVLDRAAGVADVRRRTPVTPATPFLTFSVTKAFTGMCVHKLIEQGKIDINARIADYWPEFGCKGKETATIRHAFLHQAGIPLGGLYREALLCWNWDWTARLVASLPAEFEPGTKCVYHLVNYGFILGEVIRRVTGLRPDRYMQQTLFEPLGMTNSWLGLPQREFARAAQIYLGDESQRMAVTFFRLPYVRGGVIPAASLNSTARNVATFYQMLLNGGTYAGKTIVTPETIAFATSVGLEQRDEHLGIDMAWAYGFHLGSDSAIHSEVPVGMGRNSTRRTFGHFGQGTCLAWADPEADVVAVFLCNRLLGDPAVSQRWQEISDGVWDALN
jgi:CubicO group peptidase (beta-lactamase class C family)